MTEVWYHPLVAASVADYVEGKSYRRGKIDMGQWKRPFVTAAALLLPASAAVGLGATAASASPSNAPTALTGTFDCGHGVTGTFVVNSGNSSATTWSAAHLAFDSGGTGIFVPASIDFTFSVGGKVVGTEQATKGNAPAPNSCSISATVPGPPGTPVATLSGTVTGKVIHNG
jgi:hypothetical protein